jgi:hypothetical protein
LWCSMLLRLWNTKVGVPDQSYYLHLAMQVKIKNPNQCQLLSYEKWNLPIIWNTLEED